MQSGKTWLTIRKSPLITWWLLLVFLTINVLQNTIFGIRVGGLWGNYGMPLLAWGLTIAFILWLPQVRHHGKFRFRRLLGWLAFMSLLITVLGMMLLGAISGFGKSPYDRSLLGILINIVSLGIALIGTELARAWLVNRHFARKPLLGIPLLATFFTFYSFPWNKLINISTGLSGVKFIGSELLPTLAQNFLTTYLAFLGGPLPAIIYRGGLLAVERLSPVLPLSNWVGQTLFGVLAPVLGMILVREIFQEENHLKYRVSNEGSHLSWVTTSVAAILIIWFAMGVFSYVPKVILTGSMQPQIRVGDVVIVHRIEKQQVRSEVQVGDIIMFPVNDMKVTHRVIGIRHVEGKNYYTTKGDANPDVDINPVSQGNVLGKVVMTVPKVGWLSLFVKGAVN